MKLLDSKLFEFLIFVRSSEGIIEIESDNGYFDINDYVIQLDALDKEGLIEIKSCFIDYGKDSYFEDFFLSKFSKLLQAGKNNEAKKFAKINNVPEIFETVDKKFEDIQSLNKVLDKVYKKIETSIEEFGKEIDYNTKCTFVKTQKLDEYIVEYLNEYKNDLLEEEPYSKEDEGLFGPKVSRLRYWIQKSSILALLKKKLESEIPSEIVLKNSEGYPLEIYESLILEGYINSYKKIDFKDGTFLGDSHTIINVNESKILNYQSFTENKHINNIVKFDKVKSELVFDEDLVKIRKFSNIYHIFKNLFSRDNFYEECFYDEINEELDAQKKLNNKKMYDALYQFSKERLSKENRQDFLILTLQSVAINPKYKNEV